MADTTTTNGETLDTEKLQELVAEADTGGRKLAGGFAGWLITLVAIAWSLWQLFYASPLPFALGFGIINDTEARSLHLAIGIFLAFLAFPAFKTLSVRDRVPLADWVLALGAAFCAAYLILFYRSLAERPGQPTTMDLWTAVIGMALLLEATRRAVGWPMAALAIVCLIYVFAGPYMPDVLLHKGASLSRTMSQMWLTTEGVFGVALGVSVSTIFVYVLFGSLLDRAGGGNYMMQVSFALLGRMRGGPAKVAVASSALNGVVSGSSVANVVSGGIFTIPLMKRAGYGGVKAGAIETMASVNGQIMPPVMGAAAFLMTEYVGIPYAEVVKHAILPACLAYIGLFYIVHLEALKLGLDPMVAQQARPVSDKLKGYGLGLFGSVAVMCLVYYAILGARTMLGESAGWLVGLIMAVLYVVATWQASRAPDLPQDIDIRNPVRPETWPTVRAGLHFLIPIGVLIWMLMVDETSPSLAAFWACVTLLFLMLTQHALVSLFRGRAGDAVAGLIRGVGDAVGGLENGARNMIGIAVATATAGIIVGTITLTGLGFRMTDLVELISGGNVMLMLLFTAFVCLVLGLGVPTTANYILVASLMAPVVVELGAQSGIIIPLIAVHMFVFYYGIMGDITPPVGLATFAAAAISGEDPIRTGVQGVTYALRTVILPFLWIFNPQILLIGIDDWFTALIVVGTSIVAMLVFAAVTMSWFRTRSRWWENILLLLAVFILFRPNFFMDIVQDPYRTIPASEWSKVVDEIPEDGRFMVRITGVTIEGDERSKALALRLGPPGEARKRLSDAGLTVVPLGDMIQIGGVRFGSAAQKAGFEQGWDIEGVIVAADRPSTNWVLPLGLLLIAFIWWLQGRRMAAVPRE
ncbi:MAG: TRAP transporter permease [Gemmatimonadales bacterium]|nr:TRAP transporter permease [Gemmatimonadales bacterium]